MARPWAIGRAGNGVGGVVSTVQDLLKSRAPLGDGKSASGKRVLSRESLERCARLKSTRVDEAIWRSRGCPLCCNLKAYAHGGATNGQQAYLFFIPERILHCHPTNSDDGGIITAQTFGWALEIYFGIK